MLRFFFAAAARENKYQSKKTFQFLKGGQYLPDWQIFFIKISTNLLKKLPDLGGQHAPFYPPANRETYFSPVNSASRSRLASKSSKRFMKMR